MHADTHAEHTGLCYTPGNRLSDLPLLSFLNVLTPNSAILVVLVFFFLLHLCPISSNAHLHVSLFPPREQHHSGIVQ